MVFLPLVSEVNFTRCAVVDIAREVDGARG
jgi:hypothetical protein